MAKKDPIPLNHSKLAVPDAASPSLLAAISQPRVAAVIIAAAALVAYHNSFSGPLIFDDFMNLRDNATLRRLWPPPGPLRTPLNTGVSGRPLVNLSFALNYAGSELAVTGYHVVNLVVHLATALTLFGVVRRTLLLPRFTNDPAGNHLGRSAGGLALAVATLWEVHPLLTDSVSYISGRTELLVGLFMLLTMYCMIRGATSTRRPATRAWVGAALACGLLAACCKEVAVTLPFLALLYDRTFLAGSFAGAVRRRPVFYAGLLAILPVLALNLSTADFHRAVVGALSTWTYLKMQAEILVLYLRLSFWPHPLIIDYLGWRTDATLAQVLPSALLIVCLLALVVYGVVRSAPLAYPGVWFFLILAPTSSFLPLATEPATERRMYLPLMAVVATVVLLVAAALRRAPGGRAVGVVIALVVIGAATLRTVARNEDYKDPIGLWAEVAVRRPNPARAYINLGHEFLRRNRPEQAKQCFLEAIRLDETDYIRRNNMAALLRLEGKFAEAEHYLREALAIKPDYDYALQNLGNVYLDLGKLDDAERYLTESVRLAPDREDNRALLAQVRKARAATRASTAPTTQGSSRSTGNPAVVPP